MALLLCALAAAPAAAQSDSSTLRVREAAAALVRGNVDQAITIYGEVLEDKSLPNDRRATILNDRGVAFSRRQQQKEAIDDFNRSQDRIFVDLLSVSLIHQKTLLATAGGNPPDLAGLMNDAVVEFADS